jgi:hypothetical protein
MATVKVLVIMIKVKVMMTARVKAMVIVRSMVGVMRQAKVKGMDMTRTVTIYI